MKLLYICTVCESYGTSACTSKNALHVFFYFVYHTCVHMHVCILHAQSIIYIYAYTHNYNNNLKKIILKKMVTYMFNAHSTRDEHIAVAEL